MDRQSAQAEHLGDLREGHLIDEVQLADQSPRLFLHGRHGQAPSFAGALGAGLGIIERTTSTACSTLSAASSVSHCARISGVILVTTASAIAASRGASCARIARRCVSCSGVTIAFRGCSGAGLAESTVGAGAGATVAEL